MIYVKNTRNNRNEYTKLVNKLESDNLNNEIYKDQNEKLERKVKENCKNNFHQWENLQSKPSVVEISNIFINYNRKS